MEEDEARAAAVAPPRTPGGRSPDSPGSAGGVFRAILPVLLLFGLLASNSSCEILGPSPLDAPKRPYDPSLLIPRHRDTIANAPPHGLALGVYSMDPAFDYRNSLREIANTGANAVELIVNFYQERHNSSEVNVSDPRRVPWWRVARTIEQAHALGLQVHLMPIVLLRDPRPQDWRGNMTPLDRDRWYRSYRVWIVELAEKAEKVGVEVLCIGSEFNSMQGNAEEWLETIARVREVYSGAITYSANWDSYGEVPFLEALDAIGMTTYHPLADHDEPTLNELINAWLPLRSELIRWQESHGIPMLFTEVGYPSINGAAQHPWDYTAEGDYDELEQYDCLASFNHVWTEVEQLGGVFFFVWWGAGGPLDRGYTPRGKKGLEVIERWFRSHSQLIRTSSHDPVERDE